MIEHGFKSWSIVVIEDIYSFQHTTHKNHFKRIKDLYFTEEGWTQYDASMTRSRFLEVMVTNKKDIVALVYPRQNFEIEYGEDNEKEVFATVKTPLMVIVLGDGKNAGHPQFINVTMNIHGRKIVGKEIKTDWGEIIPQYDFKIMSFSVTPGINPAKMKELTPQD